MAAFNLAVEKGFGIEMDVQLSRDGVLFVFHDYDLQRLCGRAEGIADLDSADLYKLRLADSAEGIPTLDAVLEMVNGKVPLLIEVKNKMKPGVLEEKILERMRDYKGTFALLSFCPSTLRWFRKNAPEYLRVQLSRDFSAFPLSRLKKIVFSYMLLNFLVKPDFVGYEINSLPNARVNWLRRRGMRIIAWTVKNETHFTNSTQLVDNIIFEALPPEKASTYRSKSIG